MSIPASCCIACVPTRAVPYLARQGITRIRIRIIHAISTDNAQANSRLALRHLQIIQHQLAYRFFLNYDSDALTPILPNTVELVRVKQLDAHSGAHESAPALVPIEAALSWSQQRSRHDPANADAI